MSNQKHRWYDVIVACAEGKEIQFKYDKDEWQDYAVIVNKGKNTIKVKGYSEQWCGETLAELRDKGNGVTVSLVDIPEPMYLDYAQLDYLRIILNAWQDYFANGN